MAARWPDLDLARLDAASARAELPGFLAEHVRGGPDGLEAQLSAVLEDADDAAIAQLLATLVDHATTPGVHLADPLCRALAVPFAAAVLPAERTSVTGLGHLDAAAGASPTVLVCNHLAYYDTPGTVALVARQRPALAQRLTAIAGPKVYGTAFRTLITTMIHSVSAPQSAATGSGAAAGLSLRALAQQARASVRQAAALMERGHVIVLYPEGTRSRTTRLQPFLYGAARYVAAPGTVIVPAALTGMQAVMPVGSRQLTPATVRLACGTPIPVPSGDPRGGLEAAWHAVAALLPEAQQPSGAAPSR